MRSASGRTHLDYEELRAGLPSHVEPAFDGMTVEMSIAD
jgi:hypothetical protein